MPETPEELQRHIHEIKLDLKDNFSELEDKVKSSIDWRAQFEERPGTLLAVAFGGGVLLSALLPQRRSPRRKTMERDRNSQPIQDDQRFSVRRRGASKENAGQTSDIWRALKGAAIGAAAGKLGEFVEELLPGLKAEPPAASNEQHYARPGPSGQGTWPRSKTAASD